MASNSDPDISAIKFSLEKLGYKSLSQSKGESFESFLSGKVVLPCLLAMLSSCATLFT